MKYLYLVLIIWTFFLILLIIDIVLNGFPHRAFDWFRLILALVISVSLMYRYWRLVVLKKRKR